MLNEVQRLHQENREQSGLIAAQKTQLEGLRKENEVARSDIATMLKRLDETEARLRALEKHQSP
jgi:hypothetical protein